MMMIVWCLQRLNIGDLMQVEFSKQRLYMHKDNKDKDLDNGNDKIDICMERIQEPPSVMTQLEI